MARMRRGLRVLVVLAVASGASAEEAKPASPSPIPSSSPRDTRTAEQRKTSGAIVVEQLAGSDCVVYVDGTAWPEGKKLKATRFVKPGMHTVECRAPSGATLFSRQLQVVVGRDTPLYWGP